MTLNISVPSRSAFLERIKFKYFHMFSLFFPFLAQKWKSNFMCVSHLNFWVVEIHFIPNKLHFHFYFSNIIFHPGKFCLWTNILLDAGKMTFLLWFMSVKLSDILPRPIMQLVPWPFCLLCFLLTVIIILIWAQHSSLPDLLSSSNPSLSPESLETALLPE